MVAHMLPISAALSHNLNLMRSMAAFMVVAGHVTMVLFSNTAPDLLTAAFVNINSLGHHGVVIFFVLSGFLVGRRAIEAFVLGTTRASAYIIDRITRIYIVLSPALLVGATLDAVLL
jgi:peptidoglycan/LPS O-acetylase OafA/YrhL